jgi:hypothetical protein
LKNTFCDIVNTSLQFLQSVTCASSLLIHRLPAASLHPHRHHMSSASLGLDDSTCADRPMHIAPHDNRFKT